MSQDLVCNRFHDSVSIAHLGLDNRWALPSSAKSLKVTTISCLWHESCTLLIASTHRPTEELASSPHAALFITPPAFSPANPRVGPLRSSSDDCPPLSPIPRLNWWNGMWPSTRALLPKWFKGDRGHGSIQSFPCRFRPARRWSHGRRVCRHVGPYHSGLHRRHRHARLECQHDVQYRGQRGWDHGIVTPRLGDPNYLERGTKDRESSSQVENAAPGPLPSRLPRCPPPKGRRSARARPVPAKIDSPVSQAEDRPHSSLVFVRLARA